MIKNRIGHSCHDLPCKTFFSDRVSNAGVFSMNLLEVITHATANERAKVPDSISPAIKRDIPQEIRHIRRGLKVSMSREASSKVFNFIEGVSSVCIFGLYSKT